MHTLKGLRWPLVAWMLLLASTVRAQGSENAIAAAVFFAVVAFGLVVAGLVISVLYVFKRRSWQRWVVLCFGAGLLLTGLGLGAQPGRSGDIEFLQVLLSAAGVLFLLLGMAIRPRSAPMRQA
jgi:peptidoglycan/LPS O-acetylase OafA/YrhL